VIHQIRQRGERKMAGEDAKKAMSGKIPGNQWSIPDWHGN
jgi:hypothetical protein